MCLGCYKLWFGYSTYLFLELIPLQQHSHFSNSSTEMIRIPNFPPYCCTEEGKGIRFPLQLPTLETNQLKTKIFFFFFFSFSLFPPGV